MARILKTKYGLIFSLVCLLVGLPFFHFHPDNTHTHQSELSQHVHKGHFHSPELNGFVDLIHHDSASPRQGEEHHPHSDTDTGTNNFKVNLQKSNSNPGKTLKAFKSGITQKPVLIAGQTLFHPLSFDTLAFESSGLPDTPKERSPPFPFV